MADADPVDVSLIERGWAVTTSDGYRVGDVTEIHPAYLLVSRGLIFVSDTYVPLHALEKLEGSTVRLAVTRSALRRMDWKKPPRTPLELVRADEEEAAAEGESSSFWDDLLKEEEPAPSAWNPSAETAVEPQDTGYTPNYWDAGTAIATPAEEEESYDTLGVLSGQRLDVQGGIGLSIQDLGYGRPVVLLHDWLLGQAYWDGLVPRLVDAGYRVVTLDWRGHGGSDRPWNEYWPSVLVHDLRTLVRTLELEAPTFVGHGLGAAIAVQYAAAYPGARPRRLILINPAAPRFVAAGDFAHGQDETAVETWHERLRVDRPALVRYLVGSLLPAAALDDATTQWLWEMAMRPPAYAAMQVLEGMRTLDLRDEMARLALPVTVLQGSEDRLTPPSLGRAAAAALAGAELLPFEGAGHLLGIEARAVFEETLLRVLERDSQDDQDAALGMLSSAEAEVAETAASPDESRDIAPDDASPDAGDPARAEEQDSPR
jgi:pimeloyl-ACP methyl ester carboxylesterase